MTDVAKRKGERKPAEQLVVFGYTTRAKSTLRPTPRKRGRGKR